MASRFEIGDEEYIEELKYRSENKTRRIARSGGRTFSKNCALIVKFMESGHLTISEVRRSLSFNDSGLAEDEPITNEKTNDIPTHKEHIPAEDQLKKDCDKLWQELNNTHARLETRTPSRWLEADTSDFEGPKVLEKVLNAKEKKLQTEIIALEKEGLQVTSANPEYTGACLKSQLLKSINQLEETLKIIQGQRKEVEQDLKREEEILKQHQDIDNSLTAKIASLEQARDSVNNTSHTKGLEKQKEAAGVYLLQTMKKLGSFLSANFPLPHPDDFKGTKNQGIGVNMDPSVAYVSLQQLTEDLMNMLYFKPHDPYIQIKQIHWPPYIELLLRCGVALRHPQDCNLIRLVAFNRLFVVYRDHRRERSSLKAERYVGVTKICLRLDALENNRNNMKHVPENASFP